MTVCAVDGILVTVARNGRLVHLDDLPQGVDPSHEILPTSADDYREKTGDYLTLKGAAEDMLAHHASLHPAEGCEWAQVLERALRG